MRETKRGTIEDRGPLRPRGGRKSPKYVTKIVQLDELALLETAADLLDHYGESPHHPAMLDAIFARLDALKNAG